MEIIVELKISTNLKRPILVDPTIMIKVFFNTKNDIKKKEVVTTIMVVKIMTYRKNSE